MFDDVALATKNAFLNNQLPWLLSAVTDWSYEEGSAPDFVKYTRLYERCGTPIAIADRMRLGVNGFLDIELRAAGLSVTSRKKSHGRDFGVCKPDGLTKAKIETKMSFDCTQAKYYAEIRRDREKLLDESTDQLYQVVYMVALPGYYYPPGTWNGCPTKKPRAVQNLGLLAQWRAVQGAIPYAAVRGGEDPVVLPFEQEAIDLAVPYIRSLLSNVFQPSTCWQFDPQQHLANAAVGIALWQWR
jgi:hypothetical protein